DRYMLVAHSGGALTAFAYASLEPDRLLGLILVDPPPDPAVMPRGMMEGVLEKLRGEDYAKTLESYFRQTAGEDEKVVHRILTDAKATPKETVIGTVEANMRFNPREFLGYEGPALSIIQSQYEVPGALHRIAQIETVAIDGVGHWIHLGAPERFLD